MAEENRETLLKKMYYENCPGCKVEKSKLSRTGFPLWELCTIWSVVLCTILPVAALYPFLYFMVGDFSIVKKEEDIGYYAGVIGCIYMVGRVLTSVLWGLVADRYGRKPVIIIGMCSVVIFNTSFGLSREFWMAVVSRFCLGCFNGLMGPINAYAMEIFRAEYRALALSAISTSWGIALIVGPALGGFLAQPAEKFPSIFSKESIFGKFPYFLPCLAISVCALVVTILSLWFPETLHNHKLNESRESLEAATHDSEGEKGESLFKNWPLISTIIVYCIFSLHDIAYSEIFSLWADSPKKFGGLEYSTSNVGTVLMISGFGLLVFQLSLYSYVERLLGPIMVTRICGALSVPLLASYPFIAKLSGLALGVAINCASLAKNALSVSAITGLYILQNQAVKQHQRGVANGISMTAMSLFKAIGPAGAGVVFSLSEKRQDATFLPGTHMIFFVLNVILVIGVVLTFKPFLAEPDKETE